MENELEKVVISRAVVPHDTEHFFAQAKQFEELMMVFNSAIKEVRTKFEILNDELTVTHNRSPIEVIKTRIKKPQSIVTKLQRKGYEVSISSVLYNLNDVAGVRIVCSFIDDIYAIAEMFAKQDDVKVIQIKDYIKNPKENGYRSYHMIVEIPVFFSNRKQPIRVEVQIRTIAMDFWASLEHQLRYKKDYEKTEEIEKELKECAEVIAQTDRRMQKIREKINTEL